MPAAAANAVWRGSRHQLPSTFPRSPGIIPAVLSAIYFRPPRCDCSIKEQEGRCVTLEKNEAFLLHNLFTTRSGE